MGVLYVTFFDSSIRLAKMVFHGGSTVVFLRQLNVIVLFFFESEVYCF